MVTREQPNVGAVEYQHVVVLVHGTFARRADWTHPDSPLAKTVTSALGGHVLVRPFNWSGRNSHDERLSWGAKLAEKLVELSHHHPKASLHIIAHSHGGNVAAYALRSPVIRDLVKNVVCLGTPFIVAYHRDLRPTFHVLRVLSIISSASVALFAAVWIAANGVAFFGLSKDIRDLDTTWLIVGLPVGTVLGVGLALFTRRLLLRLDRYVETKFAPRLVRMQKEIVTSLREQFGAVPVLNVQARGDEAAGWLRFVDQFASIPYRLWRPEVVLRITIIVSVIVALSLLVVAAYGLLYIEVSEWSEFLLGIMSGYFVLLLGAVLVLTGLMAISQFVCIVWPKMFRAHALGFGEDGFMKNWLVAISASTEPPNAEHVDDELLDVTGRGLNHSLLYQDERILHTVADWTDGSVKKREEISDPGIQSMQ